MNTVINSEFSGMVQVFVYGTLKPGEGNYQRYCAGKVVEAQRVTTLGRLFALPMGYPAMTRGKNTVHGYLLTFADLGVLDALDELEGYQHEREISHNLYNRQNVEVYNLLGSFLGSAWVYLMQPDRVEQLGGVYLPDGWWSSNSFKCLSG